MMLRVTMLSDGGCCVIDNGKAYLFDRNGRCVDENVSLQKYMSGMLELPVISVLSANGFVELACFDKEYEIKWFKSPDAMKAVSKIQLKHKYIRMLRRSGRHDKTSFNQLVFVYPEGTDLLNIISDLELQECTEYV